MFDPQTSCPRCRHHDAVQKVSSLVRGETLHGPDEDGWEEYEALPATVRIRQLAAPGEAAFANGRQGRAFAVTLTMIVAIVLATLFGLVWVIINVPEGQTGFFLAAVGLGGFAIMMVLARDIGKDTRLARLKWERLFYCHRCDGVFLPGDFRFIPPEHTRRFLME